MKKYNLKDQTESATAKNFIDWYNQKFNRKLTLKKQEAPDFILSDEIGQIGLEVTLAFDDQESAKLISLAARGIGSRTNHSRVMCEPEGILTDFINQRLSEKCAKRYGGDCFLVIRVKSPMIKNSAELENDLMPRLSIPTSSPFRKIYLTLDQQDYFEL